MVNKRCVTVKNGFGIISMSLKRYLGFIAWDHHSLLEKPRGDRQTDIFIKLYRVIRQEKNMQVGVH